MMNQGNYKRGNYMARNNGFGNGHPHGRGGGFAKKRTYLSGDYIRDMKELRILGNMRNPQTRRDEYKDETPQFITYLTLALQNISDIIGEDLSKMRSVNSVEKALKKSGKIWEVASFLWLHREEQPKRDFAKKSKEAVEQGKEADFEKYAKAIVVKLWEFRNIFVHSQTTKPLVVQKEFYRFVEGELYGEAIQHALGAGRKSEKVMKQRIFTPHDDANLCYEFTRKGMIFLVCLALYRHDASEFVQKFPDLQLPPREWEMEKGYKRRLTEEELVALRKKGGSVKAILDAFTYYSMRASRTDIDLQNKDYLNFANILTCLNKVPMASYNYLALKEEALALAEAAAKSTESEENKRFKYLLHPRQKDRFLTLALAFIEDFHVLDCIKFKRLDITARPERSRYMFGPIPKGETNEKGEALFDANGMDRHYVISHGNAEFEYVPEEDEHYGPAVSTIRIAHLRGRIGEGEIMRLLLAYFTTRDANATPEGNPVNKELLSYLRSYHRILERMLNAKTLDELKFDSPDFKNEFKRVSGKRVDALTKGSFVEEMKPFFPSSITRYFVGDEMRLGTRALQDRLASKLAAMEDRASDFLKRLDHLTEWKELDEEARKRDKPPRCKIGELKYPPRTCLMSDAHLIKRVLDYINLNLTKAEDKYRQLPRGLRHRGARDIEFQLLHRNIGRFGSNPDGLWRTLEKREALNGVDGPLESLKSRERALFQAEQRRCRGKLDKNGRPLRVGHTLTMLAAAATELYRDMCAQLRETWCRELQQEEAELLPYVCRMYGVRAGMPLDKESLVKTILGIDLNTWSMAYDYENDAPRQTPRRLEDAKNLIVSQVPVPNQIAIRCMPRPSDGTEFQFNPAFRAFQPYGDGRMALRKYYDVAPLIAYVGAHDRLEETVDPKAPDVETRGGQEAVEGEFGKLPPKERAGFSRNDVNRAIQEIQRVERQDKLLLACAKRYWNRYMASEVKTTMKDKLAGFSLSEFTDIGQFFSRHIDDKISDKVTIRMMPNDFARPVYSVITEHLGELVPLAKPIAETEGVYSLYDLNLVLKDLQRKENSWRLEYLPAIVEFEKRGREPEEKIGKDALFEHYKKELGAHCKVPLTREEFDAVVAFRNRLMHPTDKNRNLALSKADVESVAAVLRRFGCLRRA